jgi:hypothetical protein
VTVVVCEAVLKVVEVTIVLDTPEWSVLGEAVLTIKLPVGTTDPSNPAPSGFKDDSPVQRPPIPAILDGAMLLMGKRVISVFGSAEVLRGVTVRGDSIVVLRPIARDRVCYSDQIRSAAFSCCS